MKYLSLHNRLARLKRRASQQPDYSRYRNDPSGYCRDVLRVMLSPDQERICQAAVTAPYKVLCPSGHDVGKSFMGACLISWWYDTRNPGVCLTTAPTDRQVRDILWKEVRKVRARAGLGGFVGPKMPRLQSAPDHFAFGFTARDANRFQGQHEVAVMVVFDEAEGIDIGIWDAAATMLASEDVLFLAFYNPTSQSGPVADAERKEGSFARINCSCLNHPNIAAELRGEKPPIPAALRLSKLKEWCNDWCTAIPQEEATPSDFVLDGQWYRPSIIGEARILGRRPTAGYASVFPAIFFDLACKRVLPETGPLQVGVDVARYGDDATAWHIRKGGVSLDHQSVNGWNTVQITERTKLLCIALGKAYSVDPRRIAIAVDDCGVGGGVTDQLLAAGYAAVGVNTANVPRGPTGNRRGYFHPDDDAEYPNLRSALWFGFAEACGQGLVSLARLPVPVLNDLRRELTAPVYTLDVRGRRVVESKDDTKARIGRSPDNADSCLLAYANLGLSQERQAGRIKVA